MRFALVKDGLVSNLILAEQDFIDEHPEIADIAVAIEDDSDTSIGDTYLGDGSFEPPKVTIEAAITQKLLDFQDAVRIFVNESYSIETRFNLNAMYNAGVASGLFPTRVAYILQLYLWTNSVVAYSAAFCLSVKAMVNVKTIQAAQWDFAKIQLPDPKVTPLAAIAIGN